MFLCGFHNDVNMTSVCSVIVYRQKGRCPKSLTFLRDRRGHVNTGSVFRRPEAEGLKRASAELEIY